MSCGIAIGIAFHPPAHLPPPSLPSLPLPPPLRSSRRNFHRECKKALCRARYKTRARKRRPREIADCGGTKGSDGRGGVPARCEMKESAAAIILRNYSRGRIVRIGATRTKPAAAGARARSLAFSVAAVACGGSKQASKQARARARACGRKTMRAKTRTRTERRGNKETREREREIDARGNINHCIIARSL